MFEVRWVVIEGLEIVIGFFNFKVSVFFYLLSCCSILNLDYVILRLYFYFMKKLLSIYNYDLLNR